MAGDLAVAKLTGAEFQQESQVLILQSSSFGIWITAAWDHFLTRGSKNYLTSLFNIHIITGTGQATEEGELGVVRDWTVFGKLASL